MQDEELNVLEESNKKTSSTIILEQFTNHKMRTIFLFIFLFLASFSIIVLTLITFVPSIYIPSLVHYYNDTNEAEMHVTLSSNLLIVFVTLLSVVVTMIYVYLTYELFSETRKMRKIQTQPNISLFLESRGQHNDITDLFIQNIGMGAAYNIKFEVLSDYIYGTQNIDAKGNFLPVPKILYASKALIIKDSINYLAPTQKKRLFSTMFYHVKDLNTQNNLDNHLRMHITYEDKFRNEEPQDFTISFYEVPANGIGEFSSFERKFLDGLEDIKKEINGISEAINNLKKESDE